MGVVDYLNQVTELTNTNLELLKALNDSFYTDQNHLSVNLGEKGIFVIPSFMSLENKINSLQSNFENLVNAPVTSEAHFSFNGDSRAIEVKRYEQSPSPVVLEEPNEFYHENNNILKDFLTPVPYLKFDIKDLPNDITSVVVRKVAAITSKARNRFITLLDGDTSKSVNWGDLKKTLDDLEADKDYVLYDTTQKLPIREGQGSGTYVVVDIIKDEIDQNLDQHITVQFANNIEGAQKTPSYLLFDQTIERNLTAGDYLVNWDGTAKFEVEELNFNTNVIKMRVCYGDYLNISPYKDGATEIDSVGDISKMRFFSNSTLFDDSNYVKVPLEEDQYIFVAIAPLNDRMNIRASWGDGVVVNVDGLMDDDNQDFRSYYATCRNIGDILNEISKVMSNTTTSHSNDELNDYMGAKPVIDTDIVKVVHINKHLDETSTIKNIRALYSQKNSYNASLEETQISLSQLQETLSSIDFEDTEGIRIKTQNQIDALTKKKNELITSLNKICNEIALAANNSVVPIENAKYRVRGFFDFNEFVSSIKDDEHSISPDNIKGINVQYRYRNAQQETGSAQTFVKDTNGNGRADEGETTFIFSDWNRLATPLRPRIRMEDGTYAAEEDTSNKNLPSFNQIDIPISQGEIVDVRLKVIYDFGYPFIQMMSDWSDVVSFEFPVEFLKDVSVVTIIQENNDDIETNRFNNILADAGVITHVNDKILDQDVTFFHKPENISSGFYTAERRIIPLRDKLKSMNDAIVRISDEISGSSAENLAVNINFDQSSILLSPYERGKIVLSGWDSFDFESIPESEDPTTVQNGNYVIERNGKVSILCNIQLTNTSKHSLKIFSLFPGTENTDLDQLNNSKFTVEDYYLGKFGISASHDNAVWYYDSSSGENDKLVRQQTNQIITFRTKNKYDGSFYYKGASWVNDDYLDVNLSALRGSVKLPEDLAGMCVYPYIIQENGLKMTYAQAYKYLLLNSGDTIVIPFMVEYNFQNGEGSEEPGIVDSPSITKTLSFDVRTSLYDDPTPYSFDICVNKVNDKESKFVNNLTQTSENGTIGRPPQRPVIVMNIDERTVESYGRDRGLDNDIVSMLDDTNDSEI